MMNIVGKLVPDQWFRYTSNVCLHLTQSSTVCPRWKQRINQAC